MTDKRQIKHLGNIHVAKATQIRMTAKQHAHQLQQSVHNIVWIFHMAVKSQIIYI